MIEIEQEGMLSIFTEPWFRIIYSVLDSTFSVQGNRIIFREVISDSIHCNLDPCRMVVAVTDLRFRVTDLSMFP
jgi:hypothetical protein